MRPFAIEAPARILFGRGERAKAGALIKGFGARVLLVHGADAGRASWLEIPDAEMHALPCHGEPSLPMLTKALATARAFAPQVVVGIGGGSVLDLAKALAALIPAPGDPLDHLEVVGRALPLTAAPLPFIAIPTTAGTGAEVTKNAVIGLPEHARKVSLRDPSMLARIAIVDPALTDHCPRPVTLASGLDALTQVIEPYLSCRATPYTDALVRPVLGRALPALMRLMTGEDADARDQMAWVSLTGGLALANAGLGVVHGLAGVLGGVTGAPHGAICGALLGPALAANRAATRGSGFAPRMDEVLAALAPALGCKANDAPAELAHWARNAGLRGLARQGLRRADIPAVAQAAQSASSMKANPVPLPNDQLETILTQAM